MRALRRPGSGGTSDCDGSAQKNRNRAERESRLLALPLCVVMAARFQKQSSNRQSKRRRRTAGGDVRTALRHGGVSGCITAAARAGCLLRRAFQKGLSVGR